MKSGLCRGALIAVMVLTSAACSSGTSTPTASTTAPTSPTGVASTVQLETVAGAIAFANEVLILDEARQFAGSWKLLASSARRAVSQATWVAVHKSCPARSVGLAYHIGKATLTGHTAIVVVSRAGAAANRGSVSEALVYSAGRWGMVPNNLRLYKHGSVKADIAAAKAAGYCARALGPGF
jgi:hypothetical protein